MDSIQINLHQVFSSAPVIYSLLGFLSMSAVMIGIYTLLTARCSSLMPTSYRNAIERYLIQGEYEQALALCSEKPSLFSKMIAAGIRSKKLGHQAIIDAIKAEGKRSATPFWQKIALLNDIAVIAPMLGLLGTVTGMFYAFYDLNRSLESVSSLFDGLGISVGTTVAGLIVAILAMIFYTMLKYRLIRVMAFVETEVMEHARRLINEPNPR
jgi:biopolymer transport protein ExbB